MIQVNGEPMDHRTGMTVDDVLRARKYTFRLLAVWVDGSLVARKAWGSTTVPDGAQVQVIHMIAGG